MCVGGEIQIFFSLFMSSSMVDFFFSVCISTEKILWLRG